MTEAGITGRTGSGQARWSVVDGGEFRTDFDLTYRRVTG
jgi:hypothetical protein